MLASFKVTVPRRGRSSNSRRAHTDEFFTRVAIRAVRRLPRKFREHLADVAIVVEHEPSPRQRRGARTGRDETLYGLYEGVPLTERSASYGLAAPPKITIFRGPIERDCDTTADISYQVTRTVIHEIAHHFGIDDEHLTQMGLD
ncbi:MAG: metallopeptidase family protein [Chloroflexota bacterium]|nr:MAG: metallopeptidase family protein [Chloroflexota bacterium]